MHETVTPALFAITASRGRWLAAPHLLMLSDKLTQVAAGNLKRLMVFMPPRHGKSQLISQYFPAWYLGHHPDSRIILASYEANFAASWGAKARDAFKEYAPQIFGHSLKSDASARNDWGIEDHVGGMNTAGVGGAMTGKGADLLIIDDPVKNAKDANSEVMQDAAQDWYQSTAYTRLEPDAAAILIMTRWTVNDLAGFMLKEMEAGGEQWEIIEFPAIAEEKDILGRKPGDPLWKERYPLDALNRIESTVSAYWWAAMYQQSPYSRTGGTFRRQDFIITEAGAKVGLGTQVRFWDLAATEAKQGKDPDWTVGCLMSEQGGRYWIKDIIRVREEAAEVERIIQQAAQLDGITTRIFMEQEGGASGKSLISYYARNILKGYSFEGIPATGSKAVRAQPLASAVANGNVHLLSAAWNTSFLDEAERFPTAKVHDDQCLIAGTMIMTAHGNVPIENIGRGDMVLTRSGYHPVLNSGITNENAELYKVVFSNGSELIGTPAHPVYIEGKGFIHMDAISTVDKPCYLNASTIMESISGDTQTQKTEPTGCITAHMQTTSKRGWGIYIKKYGKQHMIASQKDMSSTTLILTHLTTSLKIWNASLSKSIKNCIRRHTSPILKIERRWKKILALSATLQQNGTDHQKGANGTKNMVKSVGAGGLIIFVPVFNVARSSHQKLKHLGIARIPVVPGIAENIGCKTLKRFVSCVARRSQLIGIISEKHALPSVVVRSAVKLQQGGTVYNLEVSNVHEYFANGILVHNCDAASQAFNQLNVAPDPNRFTVVSSKRDW